MIVNVYICNMQDLIDFIRDPIIKEKLEKLSDVEKKELLNRLDEFFEESCCLEEIEAHLSMFDFDEFHKEVCFD